MFGKVFASLWEGSLYGKSDEQLVFVYLLAHATDQGAVDVFHNKIASDTGMSVERVTAALLQLEGPDEMSRTPDQGGRRIVRLDEHRNWGWLIVNYAKYRQIKKAETLREQTRERVRRWRERNDTSYGKNGNDDSHRNHPPSSEPEVPLEPPARTTRHPRMEREPDGFSLFWDPYPRHIGRRAAAKSFAAALARHADVDPEDMANAAAAFAARMEKEGKDPQYIPHPTTWLNQDRFMEEFEDEPTPQG